MNSASADFSKADQALNAALAHKAAFSILNVHLKPDDISQALKRLAEGLSKRL